MDVPAEPGTTPPHPRIAGDVPGDEAGPYAAERIRSCPPLLSRRVFRQVAVNDHTLLSLAAQIHDLLHWLEQKPGDTPADCAEDDTC
jgi:hypothetical protein